MNKIELMQALLYEYRSIRLLETAMKDNIQKPITVYLIIGDPKSFELTNGDLVHTIIQSLYIERAEQIEYLEAQLMTLLNIVGDEASHEKIESEYTSDF